MTPAPGTVEDTGNQDGWTPGRWYYDEGRQEVIATDEDGMDTQVIAEFSYFDNYAEANARLIAAAPELFEPAPTAADLLERYAEFIRSSDVKAADLERHPYLPLIEQTAADLRAAIAKATGNPVVPLS